MFVVACLRLRVCGRVFVVVFVFAFATLCLCLGACGCVRNCVCGFVFTVWHLRLRSGGAPCDLALAVEVRYSAHCDAVEVR